ncbi:MAG TPA: DNA glycosylase [Candidatus Paceibacterota bacterium]|mgnify:FL=1|nr:DNA glycosylase [Candidatus Paceibacterota bacterium]
MPPSCTTRFEVTAYDLAATLDSGQVFRWRPTAGQWVGVVGARWVALASEPGAIVARTAVPCASWDWLADYLQIQTDLEAVLRAFPDDEPLRRAVAACRGLRLLRQDPWECLASFILSSTKQIVQIRQIIDRLCRHFGEPLAVPPGHAPAFAFPSPDRLARTTEARLRGCKMGFRAPYLLAAAKRVASGQTDLEALRRLPLAEARSRLMELPGVGRKIADCVLLFAYGFPEAFPVDVWILKALRELYFPRRRVSPKVLQQFAAAHFGPWAGYAQQYLFHYIRTCAGRTGGPPPTPDPRDSKLTLYADHS